MRIVEYGKENHEMIVLLHGGGLSLWNYRSEAALLSDSYHVVLPILDGHANSDEDFVSIEENAARIISFIDREYGGSVLCIGGLSLGAQILAEILSQRKNLCRYAIIESASVIPSRITNALIGPSVSSSYGLIQKKRFARMQFQYLHIRNDWFEDYYRDTVAILKSNMVSFLKASTAYAPKPGLQNCHAHVRIVVGKKEQKRMLRSAQLLHALLPDSSLEIKDGLYHGGYSMNCPDQYATDLREMVRA